MRSSSSSNSLAPSTHLTQPHIAAASSSSPVPKVDLQSHESTSPAGTPTRQQQPSPALSTPGRWQHPRMDEVVRRQSATTFDRRNTRRILWNAVFIVASLVASTIFYAVYVQSCERSTRQMLTHARVPVPWARSLEPYPFYLLSVVRLFFLANIAFACTPLLRQPDPCEDIPLTPTQRKLLGLPPMSRPATPQEQQQYTTPPRYSRSVTPRSSSSSLHAQTSGSPMSARTTPIPASPYASAQRTPSGGAEARRLSYNSTRSSPLSISEFDAAGSVSTPTKTNSRASVSLNSKWLYEKGRGSPNAWGTGSVFS